MVFNRKKKDKNKKIRFKSSLDANSQSGNEDVNPYSNINSATEKKDILSPFDKEAYLDFFEEEPKKSRFKRNKSKRNQDVDEIAMDPNRTHITAGNSKVHDFSSPKTEPAGKDNSQVSTETSIKNEIETVKSNRDMADIAEKAVLNKNDPKVSGKPKAPVMSETIEGILQKSQSKDDEVKKEVSVKKSEPAGDKPSLEISKTEEESSASDDKPDITQSIKSVLKEPEKEEPAKEQKQSSIRGALNNVLKDTSDKSPKILKSNPLKIDESEQKMPKTVKVAENKKSSQANAPKQEKTNKSVDDYVSNLVNDYKGGTSIKVENLTMEFNISKDKIDSLKEYIIRTLKRNKEKKSLFTALDDVSFEIAKGDRVGIIGFNGAGKSTLLKILAGVYEPTSGKIFTKGKIAPLLELGAGFDMNYSGKDNIFLNGAFLGYTEDFIKSKYDEILEFSELGEAINYPLKNYSSGMRAKLGFSIATIMEPDILIIDEILSVGDIKFQKKSSDKIRSLIGSGITVLLVSHSVAQIRDLCSKAIWIDNGKVVMMGEVNKVCDAYVKAAQDATKDQLKNLQLN